MIIELTIVSINGETTLAGTALFETSRMLLAQASGSGTSFKYDMEKSREADIIVSESFATVSRLTSSVGAGAAKQAVGIFTATGGKAVGTHDLLDEAGNAVTLPNNAIITRSFYRVKTTFTSAGDDATISLGIATDDVAGIKAAVAIDDGANPYDAGTVEGIQTGAVSAFSEKTTAAGRKLQAVVAVEALTAGVLVLYTDYVVVP